MRAACSSASQICNCIRPVAGERGLGEVAITVASSMAHFCVQVFAAPSFERVRRYFRYLLFTTEDSRSKNPRVLRFSFALPPSDKVRASNDFILLTSHLANGRSRCAQFCYLPPLSDDRKTNIVSTKDLLSAYVICTTQRLVHLLPENR